MKDYKVNERNKNGDSPLIHCLKTNQGDKMEKIVTFLSSKIMTKFRLQWLKDKGQE